MTSVVSEDEDHEGRGKLYCVLRSYTDSVKAAEAGPHKGPHSLWGDILEMCMNLINRNRLVLFRPRTYVAPRASNSINASSFSIYSFKFG